MAGAIKDGDSPTADDKTGGIHEEYGTARLNASGGWVSPLMKRNAASARENGICSILSGKSDLANG